LPHALFIAHRGVLAFITIVSFLLSNDNARYVGLRKSIMALIFKFKIYKSNIKKIILPVIILSITLLFNLMRGSYSSIISFLVDNLGGYFPMSGLLSIACLEIPKSDQTISFFNLIQNVFLYPFLAFKKVWELDPSTAANLYLKGLNISDYAGKSLENLGGITVGVLMESLFLKTRFFGYIYIISAPIFLNFILRTSAAFGKMTFIYISSFCLFFLFSPFQLIKVCLWILFILFIFSQIWKSSSKIYRA